MPKALIYQPTKSSMQSGRAGDEWHLDFLPNQTTLSDPLMGWSGSSDTQKQVCLAFPSHESAVAYAEKHQIPYRVEQPQKRRVVPKSYAKNFC